MESVRIRFRGSETAARAAYAALSLAPGIVNVGPLGVAERTGRVRRDGSRSAGGFFDCYCDAIVDADAVTVIDAEVIGETDTAPARRTGDRAPGRPAIGGRPPALDAGH